MVYQEGMGLEKEHVSKVKCPRVGGRKCRITLRFIEDRRRIKKWVNRKTKRTDRMEVMVAVVVAEETI